MPAAVDGGGAEALIAAALPCMRKRAIGHERHLRVYVGERSADVGD